MSSRRELHTKDERKDFRENGFKPKLSECPVNKKQCYVNHKWANRALRDLWMKRDCTGLEPYLCSHCGYYHLGHNSESDRLIRHDNSVKEMGE